MLVFLEGNLRPALMGKNFRIQRVSLTQEFHHTSRVRAPRDAYVSSILELSQGAVPVHCRVCHLVVLLKTWPVALHLKCSFPLPGKSKAMFVEIDMTQLHP